MGLEYVDDHEILPFIALKCRYALARLEGVRRRLL